MKEKLLYTSPGKPPSPDLSLEITLEEKLYNAFFATLLADALGDLDPLIARLDECVVELMPIERKFLAGLFRRRPKGWPKGTVSGSLQTNRKKLQVAAYYLQFAGGEPPEGQIGKAEEYARDHCEIFNRHGEPLDLRVVRRYVAEAKTVMYQQFTWWEIALYLVSKGKLDQLHRTY